MVWKGILNNDCEYTIKVCRIFRLNKSLEGHCAYHCDVLLRISQQQNT